MAVRFILRDILKNLPDLPSERKLAEELGIRHGTFYDILNNTVRYLAVEHIDSICNRFNLQPGDWIIHENSRVEE